MRTAAVAVLVLALLGAVLWLRPGTPRPEHRPVGSVPKGIPTATQPTPALADVPRAPGVEGRALDQVAVDHRVSLCLHAGLEGQAEDYRALKRGLLASSAAARDSLHRRLGRNPGPRERAVLEEILRELP